MFDTHCHLNFKAFSDSLNKVFKDSRKAGVKYFVIPGTDYKTSTKAKDIANSYKNTYFSAGLHPHHIFDFVQKNEAKGMLYTMGEIFKLCSDKFCVAVGEIGLDKYRYTKTRYKGYKIDNRFEALQRSAFLRQLRIALEYKKSVIIHNRMAKDDLLLLLSENWDEFFRGRMVFHCCEADDDLLEFAKQKKIFIGVDGDLTYDVKKQVFIKKIPLKLLVLETDSPFLTPEPVRSKKKFPNEPKNLVYILELAAYLKKLSEKSLQEITTANAFSLFNLG